MANIVSTTRRQKGIIYDLIAQGEIEGLVGGYSGVYFNGTALVDQESGNLIAPKFGSGSAANTGTNGKAQITNYGKLFDGVDLANGIRYVSIPAAGKTTTLSASAVKGAEEIAVSDSSFFEDRFTKNPEGTAAAYDEEYVNHYIRIPTSSGGKHIAVIKSIFDPTVTIRGLWTTGITYQINDVVSDTSGNSYKASSTSTQPSAGDRSNLSGTPSSDTGSTCNWVAYTVSLTNATISPPLPENISSGTSISVDYVSRVEALGATAGAAVNLIDPLYTVPSGTVSMRVSAAHFNTGTNKITTQYEGGAAIVYKGTRSQNAFSSYGFVPSAAFSFAQGTEITWSSYGGNQSSGAQTEIIFDSNGQNFGQNTSSEIDSLDLNIEFPAGLRHVNHNGNDITAFAEFQIILQWKPAGQNSYSSKLIYGANYLNGSKVSNTLDFNPDLQQAPSWSAPEKPGTYLQARDHIYSSTNTNHSSHRGTNNSMITRSKNSPAFLATYPINLNLVKPFDDFRVLIRRMSPEASTDYTRDDSNFTGISRLKTVDCYITDKLSYPTSAYAVVSFNAETYNTPPKRSYRIRGKKVKVPSNYITREETGTNQAKYTRHKTTGVDTNSYVTWDGTFRGTGTDPTNVNFSKVYTNNPAWIFYDILTDKEIGLGEFLSEGDIDIYSLYQIARYCDELVPDNKGGLEPRFSCNVYLSRQEEAYKVLKDLSTVFRSMMFWIDGKISLIQDSPKEAVYTFTQGNIKDGIFEYTYTGQRARSNQINVTWNNPEELYKKTVKTIEDTANIIKQGRVIQKDIVAFGCTSEGQATRLAEWHLKTDALETEIVSFSTGINGSFLRPGDIVNIQDQTLFNISHSGRVASSSNTTTVVLDREVTLSGSVTDYNLYLVYPKPAIYLQQDSVDMGNSNTYTRGQLIIYDKDQNNLVDGTYSYNSQYASNLVDASGNPVQVQYSEDSRIEIKQISSYTPATKTIVVTGGFSSSADTETIWAIAPKEVSNTAVLKYRILSIAEDGPNEYSFAASRYAAVKFDEIETEKSAEVALYQNSSRKDSPVPSPQDVVLSFIPAGSTSEDSTQSNFQAVISWVPPVENFVDDLGNSTEREYRFIESYEVKHDFFGSFTAITDIPPQGQNSITVPNVDVAFYNVAVRVKNDQGSYSPWLEIGWEPPSIGSGPAIIGLSLGGSLNTSVNFNSGVFSVSNSTYRYVTPNNLEYQNTNSSSNATSESFAALGNSQEAYLLFDYSARTTDPWKAIQIHTDSVIKSANATPFNTNYRYYKELGAANNGLETITATSVSGTLGSRKLTGIGTTFTSDLAPGNLIKITDSTSVGTETVLSEYRLVASIESDTVLYTENVLSRTYSAQKIYKVSLNPDRQTDAILLKVAKDSSGVFSVERYIVKDGDIGASSEIVFIRSASNPSAPTTSSPTTENPPWYTNPPSGTDILWASNGVRVTGGTEFSYGDPYQVEGTAVAEISVYKLNDSTTPTGGSYNFSTNSLNTTGLSSGWSQTPPSITSNNDSVYKSIALFVGGPEETAATATWSIPSVSAFRQDGSIGNDAKAVKLTPSSHVINYSTAGAETDTITFTTAVQSISGSPRYRFLVDGVQKQNGTSLTTFELADADEPSIGGVKEVKVEVYDTSTSPDTLLATDSVSIYAVQDGSDAIMGFLTNNAHTVSAGYDGTLASGALDTAGGTFKVFVGSTDVTTSCTFSVSGTPSNITTTIGANTGVYGITVLSADIANVTYQAVIPAATAGTVSPVAITAIYSISKSRKGTSISSVSKSNDTVTVTLEDGTTDTFTVNGVSSVSKSGSQLTITYDDGTTSVVDDGNGISSVVKSDQTVTVTYDDSTTNTFTVEDAIQGDPDYVTVSNITKSSSGTYSDDHLDVDFTFRQVGTVKAKRRYRLARSGASWGALTTRDGDITDESNTSQLSETVSISGKNAIVTVQYDDGASTPTVLSTATAQFTIVDDGLGISSVAKAGSTVTVTYDNAGTDTFTVNGVSSVSKSGSQLTITYDDGTTSLVDDGNGISSVVKNGQTVTVTYDDSTTNTFNVEDAIQGDPDYVTVSNITRANDGTTYSADYLDLDFTFRQVGVVKAKRRYRLARSGASWGALTTRDGDITDEVNVSQLTASESIDNQNAVVTVQYDDGAATPTVLSTATATVSIILFGTNGDDGNPGTNAPRTATGFVYSTQNSTGPAASGNVTYTFSTNAVSNLNSNWSLTPPEISSNQTIMYYSRYTVVETVTNNVLQNTGTMTFSGIGTGTSFNGLVTFQAASGSTPGEFQTGGSNITGINGGAIFTDTIDATQIKLSNNSSGSEGIFLDGTNKKIEIRDGTTLRVLIGDLS